MGLILYFWLACDKVCSEQSFALHLNLPSLFQTKSILTQYVCSVLCDLEHTHSREKWT